MKHALLSASGASRWLVCTPSPRLEEEFPSTESTYADEGTLAHKISEFRIKEIAYGVNLSSRIEPLQQDELFTEEMMGFVDEYATFVVEKARNAPPGALLLQEHRVNLNNFIPEGFGTVDVAIPAPGILSIVDLKYGKGVPVDAYENSQMKVYALGILLDYDLLYDIDTIEMTIYQPRIDNVSTYIMSRDDLFIWANEVLKPTAKIAFQGLGELVAGPHCRFCRVAPVCVANAKLNLQLAAKEFEITQVTDEQVVKLLQRTASIKRWLTSVEQHALKMALEGKKWPGLKLVQGRSVRKYTDPDAVLEALKVAGYQEENLLIKKPLGITKMKKIVTKLHFSEIVEPLLIKPPGRPALVDESDGRPEWNSTEAAAIDFDIVDNEESE